MGLEYLTGISIMLMIGVSIWVLARFSKISVFLLLFSGFLLSRVNFFGTLFYIPENILIAISQFSLIFVVFEVSSKLSHLGHDTYTHYAVKAAMLTLIMNMLFLALMVNIIFQFGILTSMLVAVIVTGVDYLIHHDKTHKVFELLKQESTIISPLVVIIPFILIVLMEMQTHMAYDTVSFFSPLAQSLLTGLGTGVFFGLLTFKLIKKVKSEAMALLLLLPGAVLTFFIAHMLEGNAVLAVGVFGFIFGKVRMEQKAEILHLSKNFSEIMEIFVLIPLGFLIKDIDMSMLMGAFLIFIVSLVIRAVAILLTHLSEEVSAAELIYLILNAPKGLSVGVVALALSFILPANVIGIIILLMLFSSLLSSMSGLLMKSYF
jgi:NhaP-type Na+/H+ or K+/H+ antiporter